MIAFYKGKVVSPIKFDEVNNSRGIDDLLKGIVDRIEIGKGDLTQDDIEYYFDKESGSQFVRVHSMSAVNEGEDENGEFDCFLDEKLMDDIVGYLKRKGFSIGQEAVDGQWFSVDIPVSGKEDIASIVKALESFKFSQSEKPTYRETIMETLISQHFTEEDASAVLDIFENEVQNGSHVGVNSKNRVYYLTDKNGRKKVVKIVEDENEAKIEALTNYHFSRDIILKGYVPSTSMEKPVEVNIGGKKAYLIVEEDVRSRPKRKVSLGEWMDVLARYHVVGTYIMNSLGNYKKSSRSVKEKDADLISITKVKADLGLRYELKSANVEEGSEFIHGDIRGENFDAERGVLYDSGGAGRGVGLRDVASIIADASVNGTIDEQKTRTLVKRYLNRKRQLKAEFENTDFEMVTDAEVNVAYNDMKVLMATYMPKFIAYKLIQEARGGIMTPHERNTVEFFKASLSDVEYAAKKAIGNCSLVA